MAEDEVFKQELDSARRAMFEAAMNRLQPLAAQAVDTLAALLQPSVPPSVRLGAARTVAELGITGTMRRPFSASYGRVPNVARPRYRARAHTLSFHSGRSRPGRGGLIATCGG